MRVTALSLAGLNLCGLKEYRLSLVGLLKNEQPELAVLPALTGPALAFGSGALPHTAGLREAFTACMEDEGPFRQAYLELHSSVARELKLYLAAGTIFEKGGGRVYHIAYIFDPEGSICGRQRQTHLTRFQRELGLSRGEELDLFQIGPYKAGLIIDNDARHPETGRILALSGANLVLYCGALQGELNCWAQAAGMWSQVQQNQFWAVEAQLNAVLGGSLFGAQCAIIGPCEITPGSSGYLNRGAPGKEAVTAELDEERRKKLTSAYPILKLLNPSAY